MLKNKDQILEKMPKNGQVTVLLFREGDKVNVYHVLEKPDGSFSPISNDQSPLSSPGQFGYETSSMLVQDQLDFLPKSPHTTRKFINSVVWIMTSTSIMH